MHWPLWIYTEILEIVKKKTSFHNSTNPFLVMKWHQIKPPHHVWRATQASFVFKVHMNTISTHPIWFLKGFRIFPEDLGVKQWWGSSFGVCVEFISKSPLRNLHNWHQKARTTGTQISKYIFQRENLRTKTRVEFINTFNHKPGCFSDLLLDSEAEAWPDYPQKKHILEAEIN